MQRPSAKQNGGSKVRLSRGVDSNSDEESFLDGVVPPDERSGVDIIAPAKNYNSIAVVVGKKPGLRPPAPPKPVRQKPVPPQSYASQPVSPRPVQSLPPRPVPQQPYPQQSIPQRPAQPAPQRPVSQRPIAQRAPAQKPSLRDPPRPPVPRLPAPQGSAAVGRTAANAVAVLKRGHGAVVNFDDQRHFDVAADPNGLGAYLARSFDSQRRAGGRMLAVALVVGGGWATLMPLSGAVVIPGTVVAESSVKKIQHQTGGIISSIAVTDGMRVHQGDVLIRLDDTQVRANYEVLRSRIAQLNDEISGMDAQIKSRQTQSDLIAQELQGVQQLWEKRLTPLTRLTSLQREAARIDGEKAQLTSSIAETRGKIGEAQLQQIAAKDQLSHIDLRAPVNGIVHELAVHTVGGVVTPAEVLMVIVPEGDELQIDAHLPPDEIDQVHKGQDAQIRFPAFNQRTTPALTGTVSYVSPDISHDAQQPSGPGYYTVRVSLAGQETARLGEKLIAGMPAELFIQTGSRTMMSYMFKPITEQLSRMFRER